MTQNETWVRFVHLPDFNSTKQLVHWKFDKNVAKVTGGPGRILEIYFEVVGGVEGF